MSPRYDGYSWDAHGKFISTTDEVNNSSIHVGDISRACSCLSTFNGLCKSMETKKECLIYKRQKRCENTSSFILSGKNDDSSYSRQKFCEKFDLHQEKCALVYQRRKFHTNCFSQIQKIKNGLVYKRQKLYTNSFLRHSVKKYGLVYERRNFHANIGTYHSEGNSSADANGSDSCSNIGPEDRFTLANVDDIISEELNDTTTGLSPNTSDTRNLGLEPNFVPGDTCSSLGNAATLCHQLNGNGQCSSSKSDVRNELVAEVETGECTSHSILATLESFSSVKEGCIYWLRSHGLLGRACKSIENVLSDIPYDDKTDLSQPCKSCGVLDDPRKMIICDICDDAYHLSCCKANVKKIPVYEWYCQSCSRSKPKTCKGNDKGRPSKIMGEMSDNVKRTHHDGRGPISFMLHDQKEYSTSVRIGSDFQADVPDWTGLTYDENDCSGDLPSELEPSRCESLIEWNLEKPNKPCSIGNWIQCREVLQNGNNEANIGTICGKWRRAPFFIVQTASWDCSCAVRWDPMYADCAVPQELDTEIVLNHLKYMKLLRSRMTKRKCNEI